MPECGWKTLYNLEGDGDNRTAFEKTYPSAESLYLRERVFLQSESLCVTELLKGPIKGSFNLSDQGLLMLGHLTQ